MGRSLIMGLATVLVACSTGSRSDTGPELPPEDTGVQRDTGEPWEYVDTGGDLEIDDTPEHTLILRQWGAWSLAPAGGPYTSLSGILRVQEYLDGVRPLYDTADTADTAALLDTATAPECDLRYALAGVPVDGDGCAGCAFTFRVEFALLEGDPSLCHDAELPAHEQQRTLGFHPDQGWILYDYGDAGLWLPWYPAERTDDEVAYEWEAEVGVSVEEEDE